MIAALQGGMIAALQGGKTLVFKVEGGDKGGEGVRAWDGTGSLECFRFKQALESQLGLEIAIDDSVGWEHRQFRFPRSKKRRIRKKWSKDSRWSTRATWW